MVVSSKEEARELLVATRSSGMPVSRLELQIRSGERPPLRVGDLVELPPCIEPSATKPPYPELAAFAEEYGRPCPRVELDPSNGEAATLFWMTVREDSRSLFGPYWQARAPHFTKDQRERTLHRVWWALGDEAICNALYPPREPSKPGKAGKR